MSKPPLPSSSSRAWTFTSTSSSTTTGPVACGYATHGTPSTSSFTSSSCSSTIAVTRPRLSESGIDQRERDVHHRLEVGDGDPLVGRVDVDHPVREVEAMHAARVEGVRVGRTAAERVARLEPAARQRLGREAHDLVVALEAV